jgi:hypothetical protein
MRVAVRNVYTDRYAVVPYAGRGRHVPSSDAGRLEWRYPVNKRRIKRYALIVAGAVALPFVLGFAWFVGEIIAAGHSDTQSPD